MEGPSLYLAAEWLSPFAGQSIQKVEGNTRIGKERLKDQQIFFIFSYGKYLFFQFESFALRVHFLLYGSFEAIINEKKVTGDYQTKSKTPRLLLKFYEGSIAMYNCSLIFIESSNAKINCDFSIDIIADIYPIKLKNWQKQNQ